MSDLISVKTFTDRFQAEAASVQLESAGIHAVVLADDCGSTRPHLLLGSGGVHLLVQKQDVRKAQELLAEVEDRRSGKEIEKERSETEERRLRAVRNASQAYLPVALGLSFFATWFIQNATDRWASITIGVTFYLGAIAFLIGWLRTREKR